MWFIWGFSFVVILGKDPFHCSFKEITCNYIEQVVSFHIFYIQSVQFSLSVLSDSLQPHGLQHTRFPCPSPTPGACSNSLMLKTPTKLIFYISALLTTCFYFRVFFFRFLAFLVNLFLIILIF